MKVFGRTFRGRLAETLSRLPTPAVGRVDISLHTEILWTDLAELTFPLDKPQPHLIPIPQSKVTKQNLLDKSDHTVLNIEEASISIPLPTIEEDLTREGSGTGDGLTLSGGLSEISPDLCTPLRTRKIEGKRYRSPATHVQPDMFSGNEGPQHCEGGPSGGRRPPRRPPKPGKTKNTQINIWDLILPILQPPLNHDFVSILDFPPTCFPYDFQWKGIEFLAGNSSALLGDDMGTGKTVQSIVAARMLFQKGEIRSTLLVCPLSVISQWDLEFGRWAPSLHVTVVRGTPEQRQLAWRQAAHVWITNYHTVARDIAVIRKTRKAKFDLIVLDEAQNIKNRDTDTARSVRELTAKYRWALTGTPLENKIDEVSSIFSFLKPGYFPQREVSASETKKLLAPHFLRRRLQDVRSDLPVKREIDIELRLDDAQDISYQRLERERVLELRNSDKRIEAFSVLRLIMELKKICNRDPDSNQSAKMNWLKENLPDICEAGHKVLIFSQFTQEQFGGCDWIAKQLSDFGILNYSTATTDRLRESLFRDFELDPTKRIFVGNPKTAGVGINRLVPANYVIHFDHWWNPAVTNQATHRAHRPNQTKPVFVYHLWMRDTVEDLIRRRVEEKLKLYDNLIDSMSDDMPNTLLLEVFDDLLQKYGFDPINATAQKSTAKDEALAASPEQLEQKVANLFAAMGYSTKVTSYSRDGGVDVIARRDVGVSVERLAIQCKLQKAPVGRPVLQQLLGVLASDPSYSTGIIVTSSSFSRDALELLHHEGKLRGISGTELKELFAKHEIT
jgi:superfamily II DNA or RNA helicase/HJR/Mrr/RecB family endonuclease